MPTAAIDVTTMKAIVVAAPGENFQIVDREIPEPGVGEVRIRVQACGVCHSDIVIVIKEGSWPGISYPPVPGHEVVGFVDAGGVAAISGDSIQ